MTLPPYLTSGHLEDLIERALAEDVGTGDITTRATVPEGTRAEGIFKAKQAGIVAGCHVADLVFRQLDSDVRLEWLVSDGQAVRTGDVLARIHGPAIPILEGERLALNVMQRMGGIASATDRLVQLVHGTAAIILDTRKTAPGLRVLDKWSVLLGGGQNHRVGLYDMFLIKENHIAAAGGLEQALDRAKQSRTGTVRVEIEVTTTAELQRVLDHGGADRVMLDNFVTRTPEGVCTDGLQEAVDMVAGRMETEASGNVDAHTVRPIAETGVQFISVGALTHSVQALDISLLLRTQHGRTH